MTTVARFALFNHLTPEQVYEAEHNLTVRLVPTIVLQPGFIAGVWAARRHPEVGFSFSCFTDPERAQAAGQAINTAPLQPEQNPTNLPAPSWVAFGPVIWQHHTSKQPTAVRLDVLPKEQYANPTTLTNFAQSVVVAQSNLCRAYIVGDSAAERYLVLTLWTDTASLQTLDALISPHDTFTYNIILHDVEQATPAVR